MFDPKVGRRQVLVLGGVTLGVGVQPAAFPGQLAVQVKHAGTDLSAGTQVAIGYYPRLYSPLPEAVATVGDRRLRVRSAVTTDPKTAATACTVTLTEALPMRQ